VEEGGKKGEKEVSSLSAETKRNHPKKKKKKRKVTSKVIVPRGGKRKKGRERGQHPFLHGFPRAEKREIEKGGKKERRS